MDPQQIQQTDITSIKQNYSLGSVLKGTWVFGVVERGSGCTLIFHVPDCSRDTLITRLVQEFVQPGTWIISDKFTPYFNLTDVRYIHFIVNHLESFLDPTTGAHTNTIDGL